MRHENIYRWIAQHLPKKLLYFCYIQVAAEATSGDYGHVSPNDLKTWDAALKIFEEKHRIGHKYEDCWCKNLQEKLLESDPGGDLGESKLTIKL